MLEKHFVTSRSCRQTVGKRKYVVGSGIPRRHTFTRRHYLPQLKIEYINKMYSRDSAGFYLTQVYLLLGIRVEMITCMCLCVY